MKNLTPVLLTLSVLVIGLVLAGCTSYTMNGKWSGEVDCGSGSVPVDMEWDLNEDSAPDSYSGDGEFSWTTDYLYKWLFDMEVTHPKISMGASEVDLDIELDNCEEIDLGPGECPELEATWYLRDEEIEGELKDFFNIDGVNVDCDFILD